MTEQEIYQLGETSTPESERAEAQLNDLKIGDSFIYGSFEPIITDIKTENLEKIYYVKFDSEQIETLTEDEVFEALVEYVCEADYDDIY